MRARRASFILASALLLAPPAPCSSGDGAGDPEPPPSAPDFGEVASVVDTFFAGEMSEHHIPGAVFILVKDGRVVHSRGYGHADLESGVAVDPNRTVFRVGSLSKSVTALAVMSLVEKGMLDLDAPVNQVLRAVRVPEPYGTPVTLFNLLTHTAGLNESLIGQHAASPEKWKPLAAHLRESLPPVFMPPGLSISYNDYGPSLAGLVVEEVSGRSFPAYAREAIFDPLGMSHTTFEQVDLPAPVAAGLARAYRWDGRRHVPYPPDHVMTTPAAGLFTSAGDMGRLLRAILAGGELDGVRILEPGSVERMLDRQFAHHPRLPGRAFGFAEYGTWRPGVVFKDGQASGFHARLFLLPRQNAGFFLAVNRSILEPGGGFNQVAGLKRRLTSEILRRFFPLPEDEDGEDEAVPAAVEPGPGELARYAGTYRNTVGARHTLEKLLLLADEMRITPDEGGLRIGSARWVVVEPGLFQYEGGGPNYASFRELPEGAGMHLYMGTGSYERIPWHESLEAVTWWVGGSLVLFALVALGGPAAFLAGRAPGRAWWLAWIVSVLHLAMMVGFGMGLVSLDPQILFHGLPSSLGSFLFLGTVGAILSLALVPASLAVWRDRSRAWAGRLAYVMVTAGSLSFAVFLFRWNLLAAAPW